MENSTNPDEQQYLSSLKSACFNPEQYIEKVKDGRGVSVDLSSLDKDGLVNMIVNDAQRELSGEGQVFFMFKRLNRQVLNYSGTTGSSVVKKPILPTEANFVLPLPDSESNIK